MEIIEILINKFKQKLNIKYFKTKERLTGKKPLSTTMSWGFNKNR